MSNSEIPSDAGARRASFGINLLHFFALSTAAFAVPLLSFLQANREYFVANGTDPRHIIGLALAVCLGLPALLAMLTGVTHRFMPRVSGWMHLCIMFLLFTVYVLSIVCEFLGETLTTAILAFTIAILAAMLLTKFYRSSPHVKFFFTLMSPICVVYPLFFLLHTDMRPIIMPSEDQLLSTKTITMENTPPIVFFVYDELPLISLLDAEGNIDANRFPNFSAFAKEATWYSNATTVQGRTMASIPAMLNGTYPPAHKHMPVGVNYPNTLFRTLSPNYTLKIFEDVTRLNPQDASSPEGNTGLTQFIRDVRVMYLNVALPKVLAKAWFPIREGTWHQLDLKEVEHVDDPQFVGPKFVAMETFMSGFGESPQATFHFFHLMLPHRPFLFLPTGARYNRSDFPFGLTLPDADGNTSFNVSDLHSHLLQAGYADIILGRLIDEMRAADIYDDSVIVVVSDHGINFDMRRGIRDFFEDTFGQIGFVPLFIKYPGQTTGEVDASNVQTIDIAPTVLDVLGASATPAHDGRSLIDASEEIPERKQFVDFDYKAGSIGFDDAVAAKEEMYRSLANILNLSHPNLSLYQIGFGLDFLGKVESDIAALAVPVTLSSTPLDVFHEIDLNALIVPVVIHGTVDSELPKPADELVVAVTLNGRVEGVSRLWKRNEEWMFYTVLPDTKLKQGRNIVKLYVLSR